MTYGDLEINTRAFKEVLKLASESKGYCRVADYFESPPYLPLGGVMLIDYRHGQYSSLLPTAPPSDLV